MLLRRRLPLEKAFRHEREVRRAAAAEAFVGLGVGSVIFNLKLCLKVHRLKVIFIILMTTLRTLSFNISPFKLRIN